MQAAMAGATAGLELRFTDTPVVNSTLGICDPGNCTCDGHFRSTVRWNVDPDVNNTDHSVKVYRSYQGTSGSPSYGSGIATVDPIAHSAIESCTAQSPSEDGSLANGPDDSHCKGSGQTDYLQFKLELIRDSDSAVLDTAYTTEYQIDHTSTTC